MVSANQSENGNCNNKVVNPPTFAQERRPRPLAQNQFAVNSLLIHCLFLDRQY